MRLRPLWICPRCGAPFVNKNNWHSCGRFPLAELFKGKNPKLPGLFRAYRDFVRKCGPFRVIAQKTRIVFVRRVRFAGVSLRKDYLLAHFWLRRPAKHPLLKRIYPEFKNIWLYQVRLTGAAQLDNALLALHRESYHDAGMQEGLTGAKRRAYVGGAKSGRGR
jgi:hypothetical protein